MDKADYVQKAESQLYDQSAYQKLDTDPTEKYTQKVSDTIKDLQERKIITDTVADYLTPENTTAGRFYTIPKVHKPTIPMRPIVSGNNTATERISEYVDFHLRPLVETTPSYIQDTTDFLKKLMSIKDLPEGVLLATMDVTSLYTNIPQKEGMEACIEALDCRQNKNPPTEDLAKLMKLILEYNNFSFNGIHYRQLSGTAMGTRMAPSFANLFMSRLETNILTRASVFFFVLTNVRHTPLFLISYNTCTNNIATYTFH